MVTPGGTTLDAMAVLVVALHDVVYDFGCILNSTCAIPERPQESSQIGRSWQSLHWLACDTAGDHTRCDDCVGGGAAWCCERLGCILNCTCIVLRSLSQKMHQTLAFMSLIGALQ